MASSSCSTCGTRRVNLENIKKSIDIICTLYLVILLFYQALIEFRYNYKIKM